MGQWVKLLRCFRSDDTGAITIDWVALTAGILLLGILVVFAIFNNGVAPVTGDVNDILVRASDRGSGPAPTLEQIPPR